jgi:hypothetical protein
LLLVDIRERAAEFECSCRDAADQGGCSLLQASSPRSRTLNAVGRVARLDRRTGLEVTVATGSDPRSLAIAADGRSLYVVNYGSGTVSNLRSRDLKILQTILACYRLVSRTTVRPVASGSPVTPGASACTTIADRHEIVQPRR